MNFKRCLQAVQQPKCGSFALLLIRVVVGIAFATHGWGKMQAPFGWMPADAPVPGIFQFLAAFSEFGGGIAWIIGLLVPLASLGIAITMAVAVSMHAFVMHDPFVSMTGGSAFELPATYFCIAILLMMMGPGKFSLDSKIFGDRS